MTIPTRIFNLDLLPLILYVYTANLLGLVNDEYKLVLPDWIIVFSIVYVCTYFKCIVGLITVNANIFLCGIVLCIKHLHVDLVQVQKSLMNIFS